MLLVAAGYVLSPPGMHLYYCTYMYRLRLLRIITSYYCSTKYYVAPRSSICIGSIPETEKMGVR